MNIIVQGQKLPPSYTGSSIHYHMDNIIIHAEEVNYISSPLITRLLFENDLIEDNTNDLYYQKECVINEQIHNEKLLRTALNQQQLTQVERKIQKNKDTIIQIADNIKKNKSKCKKNEIEIKSIIFNFRNNNQVFLYYLFSLNNNIYICL